MKGRILAVDDEPAILEVVRLNLEAEGYEVVTCHDGAGALREVAHNPFLLAVLDVMLPDTDGFELARKIRESSDMPIIMLSARDSDVDKAVGLGVGADDYVTKPFSPVELIARVKAHLRRYSYTHAACPAETIVVGPLTVDGSRRRVTVREREVSLTMKEFDILHMLAEHPGRVYTKSQIYDSVWGEEPIGDLSTVHVHVRRLRTKIEEHPEDPRILTTVWGIGYRIEEASGV